MSAKQPASDAEVLAYMGMLALRIQKSGGLLAGESVKQAMQRAHAENQALAQEMIARKTDRSKYAFLVLAAQIYGDCLVERELEIIARQKQARYVAELVSGAA
jgi:hypothetical protein